MRTQVILLRSGTVTAGRSAFFFASRVPYLVFVRDKLAPLNVTFLEDAAGAMISNDVVAFKSPTSARVPPEALSERIRYPPLTSMGFLVLYAA